MQKTYQGMKDKSKEKFGRGICHEVALWEFSGVRLARERAGRPIEFCTVAVSTEYLKAGRVTVCPHPSPQD